MLPTIFYKYPTEKQTEETRRKYGSVGVKIDLGHDKKTGRPLFIVRPLYAGESLKGYIDEKELMAVPVKK